MTRNPKHKFGVFPHDATNGGWYQSVNAVAWYVKEAPAKKFADKNNLVVRPLSVIRD